MKLNLRFVQTGYKVIKILISSIKLHPLFPCRFIAILVLLTEIPVLAHSQQRVQVVEADSAVVVTVNGKPVQKIWGHVHLKAEEMEMFADRAVKYSAEDLIEAFGNIQINTDQEIIWADTLTYYTDLDFAELRSRVIIKSDSSTLFGNAVDYRFTNKVAHFLDRFQLVDSSGVLAADRGFYFRRPDSAAFRGHVQLQDSSNYAEGKYLFSNRKREYYELHEKVFAFDKENNTKLSGDYLESDSTGRSVVTGNAWLINYESNADSTASPDSLKPLRVDSSNVTPDSTQLMQSGHMNLFQPDSLFAPPDTAKNDSTSQPDTTHIKARRIVSTQNRKPADTTTTIRAYENVRIWSPDFAAVSDSARYESKEDVFELWEEAKIWYNQIQLSSPYIWIQLAEGDVKKLIAYPDPFVVRRDSVIDRLNQIKGDSLAAFFEDGTLKRMEVYPNSHILRFTKKEAKPDGAIELTAPETIIYFDKGDLTEVKSLADGELVNGYYRPEDVLTPNKQLDGFLWNPDLRPQKPKKPMERRLPPIPDKPPFELPPRYLEYISKP